MPIFVLKKAAELARHSDGKLIILNIIRTNTPEKIKLLKERTQRLLADIHYQFVTVEGLVTEEIIRVAREHQVADIVIGKRGHKPWDEVLMGSVPQAVVESSPIPVIVVEDNREST